MVRKRNGETVATKSKDNRFVEKLYGTLTGRLALKILTAPVISKAVGLYMDSPFSIPLIKPFIEKNNIDMSEYAVHSFLSYNDFFTRRIKPECRPIDYTATHLISPCDSKMTAHKIKKDSIFRIKNAPYRVSDMLKNDFLSRRYEGGYCLIYRLEVNDYHRYCYIDDGIKTDNTFIGGELHTVRPVALKKYNVYKRNCREYTVMHTDNFGDVVQIEVGAMLVGKIHNHHREYNFVKGEEKGMFLFGGSTVIQLFEKGRIKPDRDIIKNTREGFETVVRYGERIGTTT